LQPPCRGCADGYAGRARGELARRARVRELEDELARRAAAKAPQAAPRPAPAAPPPAPIVEPLPPVGPARPAATYRSLAGRAAQLRLAGEVDKAVLVERQIDAMVARERRVAAAQARDSAAQEALVKGRAAAAEANLGARETDAPARPPIPVAPGEMDLALIPTPGSVGQALDVNQVAAQRADCRSVRLPP
jgi:hypothetical protein